MYLANGWPLEIIYKKKKNTSFPRVLASFNRWMMTTFRRVDVTLTFDFG